jgi:hypothetical protein
VQAQKKRLAPPHCRRPRRGLAYKIAQNSTTGLFLKVYALALV